MASEVFRRDARPGALEGYLPRRVAYLRRQVESMCRQQRIVRDAAQPQKERITPLTQVLFQRGESGQERLLKHVFGADPAPEARVEPNGDKTGKTLAVALKQSAPARGVAGRRLVEQTD